jgi:hypothetical protein
MEARQEVRLKEAEAADQEARLTETRFVEPTRSIIDFSWRKVQTKISWI